MYQAPAGLGLLPKPSYVISADDFVRMCDPVRTQVPLPRSFFLTLANWFPVPQFICIPLLLAAIVFAYFGFSVINPQSRLSPRHAWYWILSAAAVLGLFYALMVGGDIRDAYGIGRPAIQSPFIKRDGHIEPFSTHDAQATRHPRQPQNDAEANALADQVATNAYFDFLPVLLFLGVYARYIFAGFHYLFVRHPAEAVAGEALRSGDLFDKEKLVDALTGETHDLQEHPPVHETLNLLRRAQLLREKIEIDGDIADAAMRRDRARAAQAEAEKDLRKARGKLSWWQRLFTRWA